MTTITKYICDLCGEVFDDEDECQQHEILEKFKNHSADVVFFDECKNVITAERIVSQQYDPWAIFIEDEEVIPFIEEIDDYCGLVSPWSREGGSNRKTAGLYLYDEDKYCWYIPADKIKEIKRKMKEYGVDA